jgi:branched-chain amino acid transport system ATP-binding protein
MLEVEGLSAGYGDVQVLSGASLSVARGEIVALVGPNGAGKTTLIRCVTGLLRPRGGTIRFSGARVDGLSAHGIVDRGIACVPEGRQIFPLLSVEDNLLLGSYLPRTRSRRQENLDRWCELFPRLRERIGQQAGTLSGGEQQMLAVARALMSEPSLLVLDEPSLGLAPVVVSAVFRAIEEIRKRGVTILLVEQNVQKSLRLADRGYVLESGRVCLSGTGAELLGNAQVRKAYLAM